jgi:phosphohistidine phosphatase SixA
MSAQLLKRDLMPNRVYSSPWKRAWQTARILVDETGLRKRARIPCQSLAEPPVLENISAEIGPLLPDEYVALVGHEPWMSTLGSQLLTGSDTGLRLDFPKSGVMGIETEGLVPGRGVLLFFLTP